MRSYIYSVLFLFTACILNSQTYPAGFSQVQVANGISSPTVMAFAPDGRLFVAQQNGVLRIIQNGSLLTTPFMSISVHSSGERGLLGIAFDPNFTTNQYIYVYYTLSSGANNRISRFTANGNLVVPGSEVVLLNLDPLSTATNHNGGSLQFGSDGKLYVGIGENATASNAQNLDTYHGKIIRINPDGSVPGGNPFTSGSAQRQRIWVYGMRNPYTLAIQPGTGKLFVNDVGQNTWEEINECNTGGLNYGWPTAEGISSNSAFTNPVYYYAHGSGIGKGCAITGGSFFNPSSTNYPSQYAGRYFFMDYCNNWIDMLIISGTTYTRSNFASSIAGSSVCIATGPDGNLYFLSRTAGAVYKIQYAASTAPSITNHPQSISVSQGNTATFSVTATGTPPFSYQWRKNNINITGATSATFSIPSVLLSDAGNYSVVVTNSVSSATSNNATLTVTGPNQLPLATITSPLGGARYNAGATINYSGTGTDPENGNLSASAFSWFVHFHHDAHVHPGPSATSGVSSGSFQIPNSGETAVNVFYRLYLVVTDLQGGKDTSFVDILPNTATITLNTNPQGLQITLDGQPFTAPYSSSSVVGMLRAIGTPSPQGQYSFSSWSHGGTANQSITTPVSNTSYTANFTVASSTTLSPVADAYVTGNRTNSNYGSSTSLINQKNSSTSKKYESYLKFDISTISSSASSVILRLYGGLSSSQSAAIPVEIHNVTNTAWLENTINWNNKPTASTTILSTTSIVGTTKKYYEWNLTSHVRSLRNAGLNTMSLKLVNSNNSSSQVIFNSKESSSNRPQLVINSAGVAAIESTPTIHHQKKGINLLVYPNPAKIQMYVHNHSEQGKISIMDINGRIIKSQLIQAHEISILPVNDLTNGLYFIHFQNEEGILIKKIVVEN